MYSYHKLLQGEVEQPSCYLDQPLIQQYLIHLLLGERESIFRSETMLVIPAYSDGSDATDVDSQDE